MPKTTPRLWPVFLRIGGGISLIASLFASQASQAAEKILLHYGPIQITLQTQEVRAYLENADTSSALSQSLSQLSPNSQGNLQDKLRQTLTTPLPPLSPRQVDFLFRAPSGQRLLQHLGSILRSSPEQNGAIALKTALVAAAQNSQDLSQALNGLAILEAFPDELHIDLRQVLALLQQQDTLRQSTTAFVASLEQQTRQQIRHRSGPRSGFADGDAAPESEVGDPRAQGNISYQQQTLALWDSQRDRPVSIDLYRPERGISSPASDKVSLDEIPLVLMSHGLASNRQSRNFLAHHLASHGIAVAMVQHIGSDSDQFQALLKGEAEDVATPQSFVDRPLDLSFVLDELSRRNAELFAGRLQTERAVVFGHSFGAYTALAIAGAEWDLKQLRQDCGSHALLFNPSLLLQCRALDASLPARPLKDERVAAVMVFDPVSSNIFGKTGLAKVTIPLLWSGSTQDLLTPLAASQLPSFSALGSRTKYLVIAEAAHHINLNPQATPGQTDNWVIPHPPAIQAATNALGLAFAALHGADDNRYDRYLQAGYGRQISQAPHTLFLLPPDLSRALALTPEPSLATLDWDSPRYLAQPLD